MIENFSNLSKEEQQEWYSSIKEGDTVIVKRIQHGYGYNETYYKGTVKSITKTGRINVMVNDVKHTFTKDGKYWGNRGDSWSSVSYYLRQVDNLYLNHRRMVMSRTIFEESMRKLENSYKSLQTVEEIENHAYVIDKALKELNL